MIGLVLSVLFVLAGVALLAVSVAKEIPYGRLTSAGVIGLGLLIFAGSITTIVPTRNIAVTVAFGKPTGTLGNGFHFIAPWETTEEYDAAIQTLKLSGDAGDTPGIVVRLANGATARVDITVQWQIDPNSDITQLHLDYRNFNNIQDNVVKRQLAGALNAVFEGYDPLLSLKAGQSNSRDQVTLAQLGTQVHEELAMILPLGITVRSITLPLIRFDGKVQDALDKYQQTIAETQVAEQRKKTADALKAANDILSSANNTPGVLYQNCLDLTERMAQQGKALPAAWSCGAGTAQTVVPVR